MFPGVFEKVGLGFTIIFTFMCVKFIVNIVYKYLISPTVTKVDYKSMGNWALITGCTDGIGKQYAIQLASRGCDLILISRSMEKLQTTAAEIERAYKVETKLIQADFTKDDFYDRIAKSIADLEIGTLVNNVGISYMYPEYFLDVPDWEETMMNLIRANVVGVTRMCGIVMPGMVKRGKGVVINIGSGSSIIPSPLLTVYAATKAYVEKFTENLDMEYAKKGIILQCVLPGFVCSNMSGLRRNTILAPNAEAYVRSAISFVGTATKTAGYIPHALFFFFINSVYDTSNKFGEWLIVRSMETTRGKFLKKYKKL